MTDKEKFNSFYSTPWVRQSIVDQCQERNVCIRQSWGMVRHYNPTQKGVLSAKSITPLLEDFIHFQSCGDASSPADIQYWINNSTQEFIPEVSTVYDLDRSEYFIVDLDPKDPNIYSFEDTRRATQIVLKVLMGPAGDGAPLVARGLPVVGYKLRFSGNRSFHIYVGLSARTDLKKIRTAVKEILDQSIEPSLENPIEGKFALSYHNVRDRKDFILVDIGAIARHRCVRSLWSLHAKTGLACVPVLDLITFQRSEAEIVNVLARGPVQEAYRTGL